MPSDADPPILEYAAPAPKRGKLLRTIILFLAGLLALMLATSLIFQPRSRESPPRVRSASNLRQIGQAILLYTNDYAGVFPDSFQSLILQGDITSEVFVSPMGSDTPAAGPTTQATADQLTAGGHLSYVYLGRGLTSRTVTGNTVVAYEKLSIAGNGGNVLFGDGHVEWDDANFIRKIDGQAASGRFPVTMPSY